MRTASVSICVAFVLSLSMLDSKLFWLLFILYIIVFVAHPENGYLYEYCRHLFVSLQFVWLLQHYALLIPEYYSAVVTLYRYGLFALPIKLFITFSWSHCATSYAFLIILNLLELIVIWFKITKKALKILSKNEYVSVFVAVKICFGGKRCNHSVRQQSSTQRNAYITHTQLAVFIACEWERETAIIRIVSPEFTGPIDAERVHQTVCTTNPYRRVVFHRK